MAASHRITPPTAWIALAIVMAAALAAPVASVHAEGDEPPCRVRNVTQERSGRSFERMVSAASDGDRLRVRGTCLARDVAVDADVNLRGVGHRRAVLDARGAGRVLVVPEGTVATLRHIVITGGRGVRRGGGIRNLGDLTLTDAVVRGNAAGRGGGVYNLGDLSLIDSAVRASTARRGGGIFNANDWDGCDVECGPSRFGSVSLSRSVVRGNTAESDGGGISNDLGGLLVVDSLVADNTAGTQGGGISNHGNELAGGGLRLEGSTVARNAAGSEGGGIWSRFASLELRGGTRVSGNTAGSEGGGIWRFFGRLAIRGGSTVTGNSPDDCVGTKAC